MNRKQLRYLVGTYIVVLGGLFYAYEYFLRVAPSVMSAQLMQDFHLNAAWFGTLSAFYFYAYTPMQLFIGVIIDRFRPRHVIVFAVALCAVGSFLMASSSSYWLAAGGRFLQGFGSAFAFVGAVKLAAVWLPARYFALSAGAVGSLGFLGAGLGQMIMSQLMTSDSWRLTIQVFTVLGVLLILMLLLSYLMTSRIQHRHATHRVEFASVLAQFKSVLKIPSVWLAGVFAGLMFLPTSVFAELWGVPYLELFHHYTAVQATTATGSIFIGWAIGSTVTGGLSDYFQNRVFFMRLGAIIALLLAMLLLYVATVPFYCVCLLFCLFGAVSAVETLSFVVARDVCPSRSVVATAVAFINFLTMLGGMIFQGGLGELLDAAASKADVASGHYTLQAYQHAIVIIPISLALAALLAWFIRDTYQQSESSFE